MPAQKDIALRIRSYNTDRTPQFLQMKYKAMFVDVYRFFRATTHLFYEDLPSNSFLRKAPNVWLCGDLHLENYGSYKGDDRAAYFNINDFDESILGPCLDDVLRMLTSVYIAAGNLGITAGDANNLSGLFVDTYFSKLKEGYIRVLERGTTRGIMKDFLEEVVTRKRKNFLDNRTVKKNGKRKLLIDDKRAAQMGVEEKAEISSAIEKWARKNPGSGFYKVHDVAHRIAGTSSLGLKRYVILVEGNGSPDENYLLELKEARSSCAEKYSKVVQPKWPGEAQRIIEVQRRILSAPPALLNSITMGNRNYVMKELQPQADRIDYGSFKGNTNKLKQVLEDMACIYAWDNLRSSGRQGSAIADDLITFALQEKGIKKELMKYAYQYSKTIHSYHQLFRKAFNKGYFNL
jgi:uncharacterized protein (DUF2252 family)